MSTKTRPKKFCTRGEEFFDFLKALGYQPSKHQQYEHFEYLFQDEKGANLVRKLMLTLKADNCLLPEDVERYEDLKKQDMVLYGNDLEEAVTRRRAINEMHSQQKQKRTAKKNELEQKLTDQLAELERLTKFRDNVFMKETEQWQIKQAKTACLLGIVQGLIREYEKEISIDLKLLNEKTEHLESTVVQLRKNLKPDQTKEDTQYLCQINVASLLEKEEKLLESVQEMISKHGAELIIKDAGYAVQGDPLNDENIKKIFGQFQRNFDRIKHCIIYERVYQIALELSIAGEQGSLENFDDCHAKAAELITLDYNTKAKLEMENRDMINNYTISFGKEREELLQHVRELVLLAVNKQFSAITDIRARGKRKLQQFFTLTTTALKKQKVRVSLIRNLVKLEGRMYGRLVSNMEENIAASTARSKKLAIRETVVSGLSPGGHILTFLMSLFGITHPAEAIVSLPKVQLIVSKCMNELENTYWTIIEESRAQSQIFTKNMSKSHEVLKDVLKSVNEFPKESIKVMLSGNEKIFAEQKQVVKNLQQMRTGRAKEQQRRREETNQKMRAILDNC